MAVNTFTGATNNLWGTATNWSLGVVPSASDGHVATFDASSPDCSLASANRFCNAIDFTGYTNTINMTNSITCSGAVTFGASMNVIGTGSLTMSVGATLTTNGYQWSNAFVLAGTSQSFVFADAVTFGNNFQAGVTPTITLNGNLTINGDYTGIGIQTFNGAYTIYLAGNFTQAANCAIAGTASWVWNGTTDKTFSCINTYNLSNFTINGTGVLTFINTLPLGAITFQILSPCIATDCNLIVNPNVITTTLDTSLVTFKSVSIPTAGPFTVQLNSPLYTYYGSFGSSSQQLTINGSPIYIINGILTSGAGNGGAILGTSQIIATGDKFTYLDSATYQFQGQGNWRIPITVNANYFLMIGRFVLSTGGSLVINSRTVKNRATFRNLPELIVQDSATLTNIHKCKFKTVTIYLGKTVTLNEFFNGSPEFKTIIRSNGSTNYNIAFTNTKPKTAFNVNIKNCTIINRNQLTVINRDGNSGFNQGILFGESGMCGAPLNRTGVEASYPTESGIETSIAI